MPTRTPDMSGKDWNNTCIYCEENITFSHWVSLAEHYVKKHPDTKLGEQAVTVLAAREERKKEEQARSKEMADERALAEEKLRDDLTEELRKHVVGYDHHDWETCRHFIGCACGFEIVVVDEVYNSTSRSVRLSSINVAQYILAPHTALVVRDFTTGHGR